MSQEASLNHVKCTELRLKVIVMFCEIQSLHVARITQPREQFYCKFVLACKNKRVGLIEKSFNKEPLMWKVPCTKMAEQTVKASTESLSDNKDASVDDNDEVTEESKGKGKKQKQYMKKKSSMMTREEQIESKFVS